MDGYLTGNLTAVMKGDMVVVQATCKVHCILIWIFQGTLLYGYFILRIPIESLTNLLMTVIKKKE